MIGLDTNILLRWLIDPSIWPDDSPRQTAAVTALLADPARRFYVNFVVMSEALWIIQRRLKQPKPVLLTALDRLLNASNLVVQSRDAVEAAHRSFAEYRSGIHDRLIAETNVLAGCLWTATFDGPASKTPGFRLLGTKG